MSDGGILEVGAEKMGVLLWDLERKHIFKSEGFCLVEAPHHAEMMSFFSFPGLCVLGHALLVPLKKGSSLLSNIPSPLFF